LAHFATSIDCRASDEKVFAYMADFSNAECWDPTVSRANLLTPEPIGEGSRFEILLKLPMGESPLEYRVTRFEPNRCVVFEAETPFLRSLDTIAIEPRGTGCRVRYDADLRPRGAIYLFDLPIHLVFQVSGARSVKGLERALAKLR
jgi:hypothetical protein